MKLFKLTLAALLVLCISSMGIAQDYVFRVLAKKGENSMSTDGKTWTPIKTGTSLKAGQQIKVGEGAYLGLVHSTGKTFEIKTAGIRKVNELASKVNVADASVASKYADFVMNKMAASDEDINKNHRNYLSATGAVISPSRKQFMRKVGGNGRSCNIHASIAGTASFISSEG